MRKCLLTGLLLLALGGLPAGGSQAQSVPCPETCPGGGRAYLCVCPAPPPPSNSRPMPPPTTIVRPPTPNCEASRGPENERPVECRSRNWIRASNQDCLVYNPNPIANETIRWEGGCLNGYADGDGVLRWYLSGRPNGIDEGRMRRGMFNGRATLKSADGSIYVGNVVNSKQNGFGTVYLPDNSRTAGRFADGQFVEPVAIKLCNESRFSTVSVAIGWLRLGIWRTQGWYNVPKNTCQTLSTVLPESEYVYMYAEAWDGSTKIRWMAEESDSNSRGFCIDPSGEPFDYERTTTCNGEVRRFYLRRLEGGLRTAFTAVD